MYRFCRFVFLLILWSGPLMGVAQDQLSSALANAAIELTFETVIYDPTYYRIPYPGGDIPSGRGVCTDVVIRAYRRIDVDLQKEVHEDMRDHFAEYPKHWGMTKTDRNIDHRRVPNLMVFFKRKGQTLPVTRNASDYRPGDIVTWDLGKGVTHIGIVVDKKSSDGRNLIVHNIGNGQELADCLFQFRITGHFRYPSNFQ